MSRAFEDVIQTLERTDTQTEIVYRMRKLPKEVCEHIVSFLPRNPKSKKVSESMQRQLKLLQYSPKRTAMDLKGLDDFVIE